MTVDVEAAWRSFRTQLAAHRTDRTVRPFGDNGTPTPVCLLTGFLGAGKSFLVADLLTNPPVDTRIKAIVNDVGALDFDPTLIRSAEDVRVELTNGCGCCGRTAELADSLATLADDPTCDLIVLEASGAADPLGVAQVIAADPALRLDRIVAVVTAADLTAPTLPEPMASIVQRDLDSAHCVIVSACDLVDHEAASAAVERATHLAPGRTVTTSSSRSPAAHVLLPAAPRGARPAPADAGAIHRDLVVETVDQRHQPTMGELRAVLEVSRPGLVRAKGHLIIDGHPHLVQLTPQTIDITAAPPALTARTALTVITVDRSHAQPLIDLIAPNLTPPPKAVRT